jgi:hypothetical protein
VEVAKKRKETFFMASVTTSTLATAIQAVVDKYGIYKTASDTVGTDTQAVLGAQTALDGTKVQLAKDQGSLDNATTDLDNAIAALQAIEPPLPAPLPVVVGTGLPA